MHVMEAPVGLKQYLTVKQQLSEGIRQDCYSAKHFKFSSNYQEHFWVFAFLTTVKMPWSCWYYEGGVFNQYSP